MAGANAGRKPAAPSLRILSGRGKNSKGDNTDSAGRLLPNSPTFRRALPEKPADLEGDASYCWDLIVSELGRVELLKPVDATSLEILCETYARWKDAVRKRREHGQLGKNSQGVVTAPWVGIEERAGKDFRAWCSEYGLTPAAENKVGGIPNGDDDDNPFEWEG